MGGVGAGRGLVLPARHAVLVLLGVLRRDGRAGGRAAHDRVQLPARLVLGGLPRRVPGGAHHRPDHAGERPGARGAAEPPLPAGEDDQAAAHDAHREAARQVPEVPELHLQDVDLGGAAARVPHDLPHPVPRGHLHVVLHREARGLPRPDLGAALRLRGREPLRALPHRLLLHHHHHHHRRLRRHERRHLHRAHLLHRAHDRGRGVLLLRHQLAHQRHLLARLQAGQAQGEAQHPQQHPLRVRHGLRALLEAAPEPLLRPLQGHDRQAAPAQGAARQPQGLRQRPHVPQGRQGRQVLRRQERALHGHHRPAAASHHHREGRAHLPRARPRRRQ